MSRVAAGHAKAHARMPSCSLQLPTSSRGPLSQELQQGRGSVQRRVAAGHALL